MLCNIGRKDEVQNPLATKSNKSIFGAIGTDCTTSLAIIVVSQVKGANPAAFPALSLAGGLRDFRENVIQR